MYFRENVFRERKREKLIYEKEKEGKGVREKV